MRFCPEMCHPENVLRIAVLTIFQRLPCPYHSPAPATAEQGLYALGGALHPALRQGSQVTCPHPGSLKNVAQVTGRHRLLPEKG